jgi:hypothetical protein
MGPRAGVRNRLRLALVGLLVFAGGALALARGFRVFGDRLADGPLLTRTESSYAAHSAWFWPVVAALAIVVALLALRWLTLQLRRDRVRTLSLEPDRRQGGTRLPASAASAALEDEIGDFGGVRSARAQLTRDPASPELALTVALDDRADHEEIRRRVEDEALPNFRQALSLTELPTRLSWKVQSGKAKRRTY